MIISHRTAIISACILLLPSVATAIEIKSQWRSTSLTDLLQEEAVDELVQLSDDQRAEVADLASETKAAINQQLRTILIGPGDRSAKTDQMKRVLASRHLGEEEALRVILLEHQFKTLKAIWRNREIERRGMANVLVDSKEDLGLTSDQILDLQDLNEFAKEERASTLRRLQLQSRERLLSALTLPQRERWNILLGRTIEVEQAETD